ncbi:MAG TPA: alkaline D-peptidase [Leptospiraceae bacterium]|nr:alkaline D-peptidase [Spirochaetaceae bacterium]HBS05271.1 alkaline D-peptidase [Leptospiraceae bacterium]|tara:strand:+ start:32073 stop:33167 length:1095 start_codon:yes stop_codon:yes gene_type:complete
MNKRQPWQREKLDQIFQSTIRSKKIQSASLRIESGDGSFVWTGVTPEVGEPGMKADSPYFTASATKTFTAAAIFILHEQGKLGIEKPMAEYLPELDLAGLHTFRGRDYTSDICIYHLLGHTSGIPDYFEQGGTGTGSLLRSLLERDQAWDLNFALDRARKMKPPFPPAAAEGNDYRAHYSDTNYQLLGAILESVTGKPMEQALNELIFKPLDLNHTYLFGRDHSQTTRKPPAPFLYKDRWLDIPLAMSSFRTDGSLVSNPEEQIRFLRSLIQERLLSERTVQRMQQWNPLFFPFQYGYGFMLYRLPRIFSPFKALPAYIGHSGASGAINYYCPDLDLYVAGTVNQLAYRSLAFQWMSRVAAAMS